MIIKGDMDAKQAKTYENSLHQERLNSRYSTDAYGIFFRTYILIAMPLVIEQSLITSSRRRQFTPHRFKFPKELSRYLS